VIVTTTVELQPGVYGRGEPVLCICKCCLEELGAPCRWIDRLLTSVTQACTRCGTKERVHFVVVVLPKRKVEVEVPIR
jgi:hypothetical protein